MSLVDQLVRARDAFERQEWLAAYDSLASGGELAGTDFDRLGAAAFLLGRKNDCVLAYQRAFQAHINAGDVSAALRSAFFLAFELVMTGEAAVAGGWLARATRILDDIDGDVVERGYLMVGMLFRHIAAGEYEQALDVARQITGYGQRFSDADLLAMGLCSEGRILTGIGRVREGVALLDEAMVGVATGEVGPIFAGTIYCNMIEACQELSDVGRAAQWTEALTAWCDSQPDLVAFTGQCAVHRGQIMRLRGAFSLALEELEQAMRRYVSAGAPAAAGLALRERGEVLRLRGEYAAAEESYTAAVAHGCDPQPGLALVWLARGRESAAVSAVRRLLSEPADPIGRSHVIPGAVEVLLGTDQADEAGRLVQELRSIASAIGSPALEAMASYAAGSHLLMTAEAVAAFEELRRAARLWGDLAAPYEVARCRLLLGRCLRLLGDGESAVAELSAAHAAFADLGAIPAAQEAAGLLQPRAPGGLTARELEVLRLVAAGKTNPEIAGMLVLSEKTVARHLSNIFTKIGVTSRTSAAAFAFEQRIV